MLLPNVISLTDDVDASITSTSISTSTSTSISISTPVPTSKSTSTSPSTSTSTSITNETHILLNSLPSFHSNLHTLNDDDSINDSPNNSIVDCQIPAMTNKLMTLSAPNVSNLSIGDAKRFPVFLDDELKRALQFPLSKNCTSNGRAHRADEQQVQIIYRKEIKKTVDKHFELCFKVIERPKFVDERFPTFFERSTKVGSCQKFPLSKQNEIDEIFRCHKILTFPNNLNMPQTTTIAMTAMSNKCTPTAALTKIITHPIFATMDEGYGQTVRNRNGNGVQQQRQRQQQEAQDHCEQVQHNDQDHRRTNSKDGSVSIHNNEANDDGIGQVGMLKSPKQGTNLEMDNSNDSTGSSISSEQLMNYRDGCHIESIFCQMDTHNTYNDEKEQNADAAINGIAKSAFIVPLAYDENDAFEIFNIEPNLSDHSTQEPPQFAHQQYYSDVRDTSSKKVLANKEAAASEQCGTWSQPKATRNECTVITKHKPSKSSFSLGVLTSHAVDTVPPPDTATATVPATATAKAAATTASVYDKLPNFELLPNYYALELVESNELNWTETAAPPQLDKWAVDLDNKKINSNKKEFQTNEIYGKSKRALDAQQEIQKRYKFQEPKEQSSSKRLRRSYSDMTLTKTEDHGEHGATHFNSSSSDPPSPVLSLSGEQTLSNATSAIFDEMKLEMRTTKSAIPPSALHERFKHERQNNNLPTTTSTMSSSALLRMNKQTNAESLPKNSPARNQYSITTTAVLPHAQAHAQAQTPISTESPRRSENAATELPHLTRLATRPAATEAVTQRPIETNRSTTVDTIDAVLPTRTLLRRQRRMASQSSVDKNEDPIERLNRLRARISGALTEVKGVLNKYSTETEQPIVQTTTATLKESPKIEQIEAAKPETEKPTDGPVQFRFVRKVRRRSVFLEEDEGTTKSKVNESQGNVEEHKVEQAEIMAKETHVGEKVANSKLPQEQKTPREEYNNATSTKEKCGEREQNEAEIELKGANQTAAAEVSKLDEREKVEDSEKSLNHRHEKHPKQQKELAAVQVTQLQLKEEVLLKQTSPIAEKQEKATEEQVRKAKVLDEKLKQEIIEEKPASKEILDNNDASIKVNTPNKASKTLPEIKINVSEAAPQEKAEQSLRSKQPKTRLKVEVKESSRRASTGTIKELATNEVLGVQNCKPQRRTSDTAAATFKAVKAETSLAAVGKARKSKLESVVTTDTQKSTTQTVVSVKEIENLTPNTAPTNQSISNQNQASAKQDQKEQTSKSKKRLTVKRGDSLRRASIAAVEKSKIEPPLKEHTSPPNNVKAQRRASDATATNAEVKSTATAKSKLIARRPTPRVKVGAKAKRTSLIINEVATSTATATILNKVDESIITQATSESAEHIKHETAAAQKVHNEISIKVIDDVPMIPSSSSSSSSSRPAVILQDSSASSSSSRPAGVLQDSSASSSSSSSSIPVVVLQNSSASSSSLALLSPSLPAVIDSTTSSNAIVVNTTSYSQKIATNTNGQSVAIANALVPTSLVQSKVANSQIVPANDTSSVLANLVSPAKGASIIIDIADECKDASVLINQEESTSSTSDTKVDGTKKPIHQKQEKILAPSPLTHQHCAQQVVVNAALINALDSAPEIVSTVSKLPQQLASEEVKSSSESAKLANVGVDVVVAAVAVASAPVNTQLTIDVAAAAAAAAATKAACLAVENNSGAQTITTASASATSRTELAQPIIAADVEKKSEKNMPELQILPAPVKAVQMPADNRKFAPLNLPREELPKKKIIFKKILRQKSIEKPAGINKKPTATSTSTSTPSDTKATTQPESIDVEVKTEELIVEDGEQLHLSEEVVIEAPPAPIKKPRKIKKKVIIRRQQRRLSINDQTFFNSEINADDQQADNGKPITETLEKAIAYVTDDEDEADNEPTSAASDQPPVVIPLKGCMRRREFEVDDLVMYAERYKRTQVRWKKGRVLERITSISYKLEIEGKEVPAHISYIKRYTDRKVNFGGKEYLEIDYEQIAEDNDDEEEENEEQTDKPRRYSIWNMV